MIRFRCDICGHFIIGRLIRFSNGAVCRSCFNESGLSSENLHVAYRKLPVHVVLDGGDEEKQAQEREETAKAAKIRLENHMKQIRDAKAEKEKIKRLEASLENKRRINLENKEAEQQGLLKTVITKNRLIGDNDVIEFYLDRQLVTIREMGRVTKYNLEQILEFEVLENGYSIAKGGVGRALIGAALFGAPGAVVGAVTGGKKSKDIVTSLQLKLTLYDPVNPVRYIEFMSGETKRDSYLYRNNSDNLSEAVAMLKIMFKKHEHGRAEAQEHDPIKSQTSQSEL